MTGFNIPPAINRLSQDHIDMRMALAMLEREVAAVAQYHDPDADLLGGCAQYFADVPAHRNRPIADMIHGLLTARAPKIAALASNVAEREELVAQTGELAMMTRNLFIDPPKWRIPFCATARRFIALKRDHIREEEKLHRLALEHLRPEDWRTVDRAAQTANAAWNDRRRTAPTYDVLGFTSVRGLRAIGAARPR